MHIVKRVILLAVIFVLYLTLPALAGIEVVVVQSSRAIPYQEALQGFVRAVEETALASGPKSVQPIEASTFVLAEEHDTEALTRQILAIKPRLLVAIGHDALSYARQFLDIPVVYLMVSSPQSLVKDQDNVLGVGLDVLPEIQLARIKAVFPEAKRIGVVFDPHRSKDFIRRASVYAQANGLVLETRPAETSRAVPGFISAMAGAIDVLWMIPDLTVVTPETVEHMLIFSLERRVPLVTFAAKYVGLGASMAVVGDDFAMGEEAGALVKQILAGVDLRRVLIKPDQTVKTLVNVKVLQKLGVPFRNGAGMERN